MVFPGFSAQYGGKEALIVSSPCISPVLIQVLSFYCHEISVSHSSAYNFTWIQSSPTCPQTFYPEGSGIREPNAFL